MKQLDRLLNIYDADEPRRAIIEAARERDTFNFTVERTRIQSGKSFSAAAMEDLESAMRLFMGARILARWDQTAEPPSVLKVTVTVNAQ